MKPSYHKIIISSKKNMGIFGENILVFSTNVWLFANIFGKNQTCVKKPHMCILADVWLLPNMFGKNQTRWYIYTWVLFSTHVWILTHRYGKRHTCVQKATQLYVCKCLAFSTHVWEKPLTCLFPPELWVGELPEFNIFFQDEISANYTRISLKSVQNCPVAIELESKACFYFQIEMTFDP